MRNGVGAFGHRRICLTSKGKDDESGMSLDTRTASSEPHPCLVPKSRSNSMLRRSLIERIAAGAPSAMRVFYCVPKLFNLRADPFERGDESIEYDKRMVDRTFVKVPMQPLAARWMEKDFPARQKPASFDLGEGHGENRKDRFRSQLTVSIDAPVDGSSASARHPANHQLHRQVHGKVNQKASSG